MKTTKTHWHEVDATRWARGTDRAIVFLVAGEWRGNGPRGQTLKTKPAKGQAKPRTFGSAAAAIAAVDKEWPVS